MQTWDSLERKNIMKIHKQLTVLASEIEPQGQLEKNAMFLPILSINIILNLKFDSLH